MLPGGVPRTQTRQVEEVRAQTMLGVVFICSLQGMVRLDGLGVRIGRQAEASRADRSFYVAGVGRL